jgi:hypothetical protein
VAPVTGLALVAHGGIAGAMAEALVAIAVAAVLVAVWIRERRSGDEAEVTAELTEDE